MSGVDGYNFYKSKGLKHVGLYIPPSVHKALVARAKRDLRTLHMTITKFIMDGLKRDRG